MVSILNAYRDLVRLREINVVLVRHGFGQLASRLGFRTKKKRPNDRGSVPPPGGGAVSVHPGDGALEVEISAEELEQGEAEASQISVATRARLVLQDLGPSFVKLGQIISTRTDILPPDLLEELKKLQDSVPPVPFEEIRKQVETALGRSLEDVYETFEEEPLAAASIGQVHRARLRLEGGEAVDVVVKVQRPGIGPTIARDLDLLHVLAKVVEKTIPESHVYSPSKMVENFDRSITAELDYTIEADNAARFIKNFEGRTDVVFPRVYREASGRTVLTQEFLPGRKIDAAVQAGFTGKSITKLAVGAIVKMAFEDGFFHADPHPGNVLILGTPDAPVMGLIDLGMVGRLSAELRDRTVDLLIAAAREDSLAVADALYAIGMPTRKVDMRAYRAEVTGRAEKYLGRSLKDLQASALVADLVEGASLFGIEIPPDFLMAGKALLTLDGIGKEIDPDLDILQEARPYMVEILKQRYSPEKVMMDVWRGMERLSTTAYDVPQQLREVLDDLRLGRLSLRVTDDHAPRSLDRLGRRVFSAITSASLILGGSAMVATKGQPILGYVSLALGVVLVIGHTLLDLRRSSA
jgi:ubiquinone biosynthesis protein